MDLALWYPLCIVDGHHSPDHDPLYLVHVRPSHPAHDLSDTKISISSAEERRGKRVFEIVLSLESWCSDTVTKDKRRCWYAQNPLGSAQALVEAVLDCCVPFT